MLDRMIVSIFWSEGHLTATMNGRAMPKHRHRPTCLLRGIIPFTMLLGVSACLHVLNGLSGVDLYDL